MVIEVAPLASAGDKMKEIQGICLDIDDTLSTDGKLTASAYNALWMLRDAGFKVVPVTGRPAGWCDHIARFWPVDAVIGENGAFVMYMEDGALHRFNVLGEQKSLAAQEKLTDLRSEIEKNFPSAKLASDQRYREFDLAIDICEDVSTWENHEVEKLLNFCYEKGAHAKLSSIHVNTWYGDYDKQSAFKEWIKRGAPGVEGKIPSHNQWIYIGDSPNDAPAFDFFKYSVGVANLKKYLPIIKTPPTWITSKKSGEGFVELAKMLCSSR